MVRRRSDPCRFIRAVKRLFASTRLGVGKRLNLAGVAAWQRQPERTGLQPRSAVQQRGKPRDRHRPSHVIALREVPVHLSEDFQCPRGFHALGHDAQAEAVRQRNRRADEKTVLLIAVQMSYKGFVDLAFVGRDILVGGER